MQLIGKVARWRRLRITFGVSLVLILTAGAPWMAAATYFVDAAAGNDANDGLGPGTAFETITHALSVSSSGDTVEVASGVYDAANGEAFPLELRSGVAVIGAGRGSVTAVTVIDGGSGYDSIPEVSFTGGSGMGAEGFAVVEGGSVTEVVVTGGGGGYISAPDVVFAGGTPESAATATSSIGAGVSTISAPEGMNVFFNDEALSDGTRLSGFLLQHDTGTTISDVILEFAVGAFTMAPRIDDNAFLEGPPGDFRDTGILFYDAGSGNGAFTPIIENNTLTGLDLGFGMSTGTSVGGVDDDFSPTIRSNSLSRVTFPFRIDFSSSQAGDVAPVITGNTTWRANRDFRANEPELGPQFDRYAPTISNNTFREAASSGFDSMVAIYSGNQTWSPTVTGNTITSPGGNGIQMTPWISQGITAGDPTLSPTISGNTITDAGSRGLSVAVSTMSVLDGASVEISPTIENNAITGSVRRGMGVFFDSLADGELVMNLTVSGNRVEESGSTGIRLDLEGFDSAQIDGLTANWIVSNNSLTDNGIVANKAGISLSITALDGVASGTFTTTVIANTVSGSGEEAVVIDFSPHASSGVESRFLIDGNTLSGNDDGLAVQFSSAADADQTLMIRGNTITGNAGDGLALTIFGQEAVDQNDLKVSGNLFEGNDIGIRVEGVDGTPDPMLFSCNTITNNLDLGVEISFSITTTAGGAAVNFGDGTPESPGLNQLQGNLGFDFRNDTALAIKAENNWWGTADAGTIDGNISDDEEGTGGPVDFEPFLAGSAAITHSIVTEMDGSLVGDNDGSGDATAGDTLRFCTTVTAGGNCGTGQAISVTIPIPDNTSLVPGSITTDGGAIDGNEASVVVNGIVLESGEQVTICFDVIVEGGPEVSAEATADGPDVSASSDAATIAIAVPATVADIPASSEWGLTILAILFAFAGLFALRRQG